MPTQSLERGFLILVIGLTSWLAACGDDDEGRPPRAAEQSDSGGAPGASGATASSGATGQPGPGGQAGQGGVSSLGGCTSASGGTQGLAGGAGTAGSGPNLCGNGVIDGYAEQCDGTDFGGLSSCLDLGFEEGSLRCNDDCTLDASDCSGTEDCYDARDNDGDGAVDCVDSDCDCSSPCEDTPVLPDPSSISGNNAGSADLTTSSCSMAGGPEVIYEFVATTTGMLHVSLDTSYSLSVALRSTCDLESSETACSFDEIERPVSAGETFYVVVEGSDSNEAGQYRLSIGSRALNECGDGYRDADEQCDDGGFENGDGCDDQCRIESSENEESANMYVDPFYGSISPVGDVDVIEVEVTEPRSTMRVETFDLNDGSCLAGKMDSYVEIIGPGGETVLASDDDSGLGECAVAIAPGLDPATYYVLIRAADGANAQQSEFPYWLWVALDACGNGAVAAGEECDDGNLSNGDGCSDSCLTE